MAKVAAPTPKPTQAGTGKTSEAIGARKEVVDSGFGNYYDK